MPAEHDHNPRLFIRPPQQSDFAAVAALSARVYGSGYSLDALVEFRAQGTVLNLKDRRHDLYQTTWAVVDYKD